MANKFAKAYVLFRFIRIAFTITTLPTFRAMTVIRTRKIIIFIYNIYVILAEVTLQFLYIRIVLKVVIKNVAAEDRFEAFVPAAYF